MRKLPFKTPSRHIRTLKAVLFGFFLATVIYGALYMRPRVNAYMNAVRIAHKNPDVLESLSIEDIKKEGKFELTLKNN